MLNECNLKNFIECAIQHCNKNTPDKVFSFRDLVECLRSRFKTTIVEYEHNITTARDKAKTNLKLGNRKRKRCYGVYIIYCVYSTEKECEDLVKRGCGEVLYIGKGGTLECDAQYKDQDVIERVFDAPKSISSCSVARVTQRFGCKPCNEGQKNSRDWFDCLKKVSELICLKKANYEYKLCIEIICIDVVNNNNRTPQCKLLTPAFIESLLLSCYLCEKGELPLFNSEL